jgi:peptide alpha-N-acetyltransferase
MRFVTFLNISLQVQHTELGQITLETEIDNIPSLKLYERLGFLRTKRLHRYYLNGNSAYRMILYLKEGVASKQTQMPYDPPY